VADSHPASEDRQESQRPSEPVLEGAQVALDRFGDAVEQNDQHRHDGQYGREVNQL